MEGFIFALPTIIIFLFFLIKIFSLIKKVFNSISKSIETISKDDRRTSFSGDSDDKTETFASDYDEKEVKEKIAAAEEKTFLENKEKILNQRSESAENKKDKKSINKEDDKLKKIKRKKDNRVFGEMFSEYNEVQKAVIYSEILSKPKSLKRK